MAPQHDPADQPQSARRAHDGLLDGVPKLGAPSLEESSLGVRQGGLPHAAPVHEAKGQLLGVPTGGLITEKVEMVAERPVIFVMALDPGTNFARMQEDHAARFQDPPNFTKRVAGVDEVREHIDQGDGCIRRLRKLEFFEGCAYTVPTCR